MFWLGLRDTLEGGSKRNVEFIDTGLNRRCWRILTTN
jgi:hypothetical protein